MSGMVEQVGRAIAKHEGYAWDPLPYDAWARSVLAAMREPTPEMLAAFDQQMARRTNPRLAYIAMIDAALSE